MSSGRLARRLLGSAMVLAAVSAACGGDEGPAAPGGRNGVVLRYVSPRLQIVPADSPARVELALEVRRAVGSAETEPWPAARLRVVRAKGLGAPSSDRISSDQDGIARVEITMPPASDKTAVIVSLERDSDSFLPFDVVSAPVLGLDLAPGEIEHLDPPRDGTILRFASGDEAHYVLMPYQTDLERGGTPYRFYDVTGAGAASFGAEAPAEPHRAALPGAADPGRDIVSGDADPGPLTPSAGIAPRISIGSCRISADREAPLRYLGRRIAIYVDDEPGLHQARIDSLGILFDDRIEPTNTRLFGPMTDLDGNGVVLAILSPDLQDGLAGAYCDAVRLRHVEAFYVRWHRDRPIELTLSALAHEHQHVINGGHQLRKGGQEALWLNEGMSLAGEAANGMWLTVLQRAWRFLNGQNGGLTMLPVEYDRAFDDAYMMFLVYLGDRFGPDFFLRLGTSRARGLTNVEDVTGLPFEMLLRDWFTALAVSGRGVEDPRYAYRTLDLDGMEEEIAACRCVPLQRFEGMRLEPLFLGEGFDTFRALNGADADYYELIAPEGVGGATGDVYYDAYGRQTVKLSVARIR